MSDIIGLNVGSCQNCYKCIRNCPIKSISFKNDGANVIKTECVLCGTCVQCCPQDAKVVRDETPQVKKLMEAGERVYLSLAPSWEAYFDGLTYEELCGKLLAAGFAGVEETAIGAAATSGAYIKLLEEAKMPNIITTACPSVVMLVEQHYPELLPMLAPVLSPMEAHAKRMRETYGEIRVVFAGPCLSKMREAEDPLAGGFVNHVLTFSALDRWLSERGPAECAFDAAPGVSEPVSRLYPKPAGILGTISREAFCAYRPVAVDGFESCTELFDWLRDSGETGLFLEVNLCKGGCLGGPVMRLSGKAPFRAVGSIDGEKKPRDARPSPSGLVQTEYPRVFANRKARSNTPTEEAIRGVLAQIGKTSPEQELNCGSCGYPTCRAKALAVLQGKAELTMCLPYLRERAENISATVIQNSPNGIIALDKDLLVLEMNPKAEAIFGLSKADTVGYPIVEFFCEDAIPTARESGRPVTKTGVATSAGVIAEETFIHIRDHDMYIVFVKDITAEEQQREKLDGLRNTTIEAAQKVIDKQMRVAQEIASLLGETTAETKVVLTKLQKSMNER